MPTPGTPSTEPVEPPDGPFGWERVLSPDELPEGRVVTVTVGNRQLAITHHDGSFGALDNACPHQGGPLGEGSIEKGWLRCPWHGYDYSPCNGRPPEGFSDAPTAYAIEPREDGVYVALPPEPEPVRTVSDVLVETMTNWGVRAVFGMVGHSNLGFADAMRRAEERGELRYFGIRHEGAAAFAASAYGKLTGELAGCFGIAGPGSTNLLTGLYDAERDRAPILALCGQVPSKVRGRGAFQDLDLEAAFADVATFSETIQPNADAAELMTLACKTALVERRVSQIVLPDEVQIAPSAAPAGEPDGRTGSNRIQPPSDVVGTAVELLGSAERPVFICGYGTRDDVSDVIALAEQVGAPVLTTFKAKGLIPDSHPLGCGVLGRSGTPIASWFMNESDLLVVFGASFSNHTGIADYKTIIQVDYDPMALGRFHSVDVPVLGHVGVTAVQLSDALAAPGSSITCKDHRPEVAERWSLWRAEKASRRADDRGEGVNAAAVFDSLTRLAPEDAVICADVGNNTYSFGRYFEATGQSILMSGYLGSIGFGYPAAMGAWAAVGDSRKIIAVTGDGGFGQYAMEVATAAKYEMDITHVLLVNNELGKITKEQRAAHLPRWQTGLVNPDFAAFAESCGALGISVGTLDELDPSIERALQHPGPATVSVESDTMLI